MARMIKTTVAPFRIAASTALFFCGVEAACFEILRLPLRPQDFITAVSVAFAVSILFALAAGGAAHYTGASPAAVSRLSSLAWSLALLWLLIAVWVQSRVMPSASGWELAAAFLLLLALVAALGRLLWTYLISGGQDIAAARFQALAPVSALCAGLFSCTWMYASRTDKPSALMAFSALLLLCMFVAGQYLFIRFIWTRRRAGFRRLGLASHIIVIIAVPLAALAAWFLEWRHEHKTAAAGPGKPSVILITIDTLRADHLSSYHHEAPSTPAMDALAADGVLFKNVNSTSSWTPTSVGAILTGLHPSACGAGTLMVGERHDYTGPVDRAVSLAEVFQQEGYVTAAFVHSLWLTADRGYAQGFRTYHRGRAGKRSGFLFSRGLDVLLLPFMDSAPVRGEELTMLALEWLDHRPSGPFFLWLHYFDPHLPYVPHKEYPVDIKPDSMVDKLVMLRSSTLIKVETFGLSEIDKRFARARYAAEVRFTDDLIQRVVEKLKEQGVYRDSVIALTSDHGEEFWEHGGFGHGHAFHNEITRVPLIIKLPGNKRAGSKVSRWVSNIHTGATMLEAAGIESPFPGRSLLSCLDARACGMADKDSLWYAEGTLYGDERGAAGTAEGVKVKFHGDGSVTCYDLAKDPGEEDPLTPCPWPETLPPPEDAWKLFRADTRKTFNALDGPRSIMERVEKHGPDKLRALGYVQ